MTTILKVLPVVVFNRLYAVAHLRGGGNWDEFPGRQILGGWKIFIVYHYIKLKSFYFV